jgi:hypothetical protein
VSRNKTFASAAAVVWTLFVAAQSQAGFVKATLDSNNTLSPSAPVTINLGDGSKPSINYTPGAVNWTLVSSDTAISSHFSTFCLELTQGINPSSTYTYTLANLANAPTPGSSRTGVGTNGMGTTKANEIAQLWSAYYASIGGNGDRAAAFQLAIWKIEYDWGDPYFDNFTSNPRTGAKNYFQASGNSTAIGLATSWLDDLKSNTYTPASGLWAMTNPSAQDQIVQIPTPVPPGAAMATTGVICLFAYGFFRNGMRFRLRAGALVPARSAFPA